MTRLRRGRFVVHAEILDGNELAQSVRAELEGDVTLFQTQTGITPGLAVILVGSDPASAVYVRKKQEACQSVGMASWLHAFPKEVSEKELLAKIDQLNRNPSVHGILVQLPLPKQIRVDRVQAAVDPLKDVDGFHPENAGLLALGRPRFVPCTPLGIQMLLIANAIETEGRHVVVFGRSATVGRPMALLLLNKDAAGGNATVTICHTGTRDPVHHARQADILIVATGRPESVSAEWVKPGAVVVDVGIHRRTDGRLCGDVRLQDVSQVAGWITPVPGGVGPMTVAMLLKNTYTAARMAAGLEIL
jgi:methylenetetrahydrofolate dehydrogenase (NADP+)/methenyltetrahydrofolate cyclohydrolase